MRWNGNVEVFETTDARPRRRPDAAAWIVLALILAVLAIVLLVLP